MPAVCLGKKLMLWMLIGLGKVSNHHSPTREGLFAKPEKHDVVHAPGFTLIALKGKSWPVQSGPSYQPLAVATPRGATLPERSVSLT